MCSLADFVQLMSLGHTTRVKVYICTPYVRRIHKLCPKSKMERFEKIVNGFLVVSRLLFSALNMPLESLK